MTDRHHEAIFACGQWTVTAIRLALAQGGAAWVVAVVCDAAVCVLAGRVHRAPSLYVARNVLREALGAHPPPQRVILAGALTGGKDVERLPPFRAWLRGQGMLLAEPRHSAPEVGLAMQRYHRALVRFCDSHGPTDLWGLQVRVDAFHRVYRRPPPEAR